MSEMPAAVAAFLAGKRIAVAGVSRRSDQAANAIFVRLHRSGHDVVPVNPKSSEVEGVPCYRDIASIPGEIDGVVIVTPPGQTSEIVRQCIEKGVRHVWFHRAFGSGSVSKEAVAVCKAGGINTIVGGCPLMYCEPVDPGHRCIRWYLTMLGRVPV